MTSPRRLMGAGLPALTANEIIGGSAIGLVATGSTQADALQLSQGVNTITTSSASTGVKLPPAEANAMCVVNNQSGQTLAVYPNETAGVTVDSTTSASVANSRAAIFFCTGLDWAFCYGA